MPRLLSLLFASLCPLLALLCTPTHGSTPTPAQTPSATAQSQKTRALHYLDADSLAFRLPLPPPPAQDCPEGVADLETVRRTVATRTPEQYALAHEEEALGLHSFARVLGPALTADTSPALNTLLERLIQDSRAVTGAAKKRFNRPRPFEMDSSLTSPDTDWGPSYPSGHACRGLLLAELLAQLFPEKQDALREAGRLMGWNRVILGVHYPSDLQASRLLALVILEELPRNQAFQDDLARARAEITRVTTTYAESATSDDAGSVAANAGRSGS